MKVYVIVRLYGGILEDVFVYEKEIDAESHLFAFYEAYIEEHDSSWEGEELWDRFKDAVFTGNLDIAYDIFGNEIQDEDEEIHMWESIVS